MAFRQRVFDRYVIKYNNHQLFEAQIDVYGQDGMVGQISFVKNNKPVPLPSLSGNTIKISYTINRFNDVITILRTEKPLQLMANTHAKQGGIISSAELVGEEEGT